ncbi:MAG: hypothetical protein SGJ19_23585 [Planctomycetia bacterium]|nr:hypothetical protein [Planctomycetia bacterium]
MVGAAGTPEYSQDFTQSAELWRVAAEQGQATVETIGVAESATTDKEALHATLERLVPVEDRGPLWIVLLGHGTFSGNVAKFNLRGPDVSAVELGGWLESAKRPLAIINCTSASGPFINALSDENRVVITATKSGDETNYARFGTYLAQAIGDASADLDKDGQVSLLEGFLIGSGRVAEFYRADARLATEHALLDDNGDKLGMPGDWFAGVRATKRAEDGAALDGMRAHQLILIPSSSERKLPEELRQRRDELEVAIETLRDEKAKLTEDDYYAKLEPLMLELGRIYQAGQSSASTE